MPFLNDVKLGTYTLENVEHRVDACGFDVRGMSGSVSIFAYDEDGDPLPKDGEVIQLADHPELLKQIAESVENAVEEYLADQESVKSAKGCELACDAKQRKARPEGKTIAALAEARIAELAPEKAEV